MNKNQKALVYFFLGAILFFTGVGTPAALVFFGLGLWELAKGGK